MLPRPSSAGTVSKYILEFRAFLDARCSPRMNAFSRREVPLTHCCGVPSSGPRTSTGLSSRRAQSNILIPLSFPLAASSLSLTLPRTPCDLPIRHGTSQGHSASGMPEKTRMFPRDLALQEVLSHGLYQPMPPSATLGSPNPNAEEACLSSHAIVALQRRQRLANE